MGGRIFSFNDLVSDKQLGTYYPSGIPGMSASLLKSTCSDPQPAILVAMQGGTQLMDIARLEDGAWLMSRNEISVRYQREGLSDDVFTPCLQHMFGDDRAYLVLGSSNPSLRIGFLQPGLLAPAVYGRNDMGASMVADLDGDGIPEIFNERKVYALAETMPYHPQEHHLVDTWVFSSSGMNDKAHEELRRRHAAGQEIKGNKSEQWKDNWWRFQNCSLPLIRSMAGDRSHHYVFDSRGLGNLVKEQRIIPEVDVDDFSRTRSYHLIRARWQLTMMLDYTLGDDYIAKCEILDKAKPIHVPAFFTEKTGPDLNANIMACLREANAFLAANNVVLPTHAEGDTLPALAEKIPLAILDMDALAVPRRSSDHRAAAAIGQTLLGAFERTGKFRLLERAELRTILEEQNLARLGRQTDAPNIVPSAIVIAGALVPTGAGHHLSLRAYDTETGIIFSSLTHGSDQPGFQITPETIDAYARQLADDVVKFQPYKYRLMSEIYLDYLRFVATGQERTLPSTSAPASTKTPPPAPAPTATDPPAVSQEPPVASLYHLTGDVSTDTVIDMSKGPPCVNDELTIAHGVTLTIAEGTTLQINHVINSKYGSRLVLMPGVTIKFGDPKGSMIPGMNLSGTLEIRGTKDNPVNIHGTPGVGINDKKNPIFIGASRGWHVDYMEISFAHVNFRNGIFVEIESAAKTTMVNCSFNDLCSLDIRVEFSFDGNAPNAVFMDQCTFAHGLAFQNCDVIASDCRMNRIRTHMQLITVELPDKSKGDGIIWPRRLDHPSMIFRRCQLSNFSASAMFHHTKPMVMFEECNLSESSITWEYRDVKPENYMKYHDIPKELVAELDPQTHKNILFRNCRWDPEKMPRMTNVYPAYEGTSPGATPGKDLPASPPTPEIQPPSSPKATDEASQPWTVPGLAMELMPVPAGRFQMGSSDDGENDRQPVHEVRISRPYWIGKYEVTQKQWKTLMESTPFHFKDAGDDLPAENITWQEAVDFCNRLTKQEQAAGRLPPGYAFRLPTEAEWEYAARGGSHGQGYRFSGSNKIDEAGWVRDNSGQQPQPVGRKKPNELGIYDMSGNVWEWCHDWHGPYPEESETDPVGPPTMARSRVAQSRVARGGGWCFYASAAHVDCRKNFPPATGKFHYLGFRICLAPELPPSAR
jgi:formylglycine-generating enzyme required for sulfatase activity